MVQVKTGTPLLGTPSNSAAERNADWTGCCPEIYRDSSQGALWCRDASATPSLLNLKILCLES